MVIKNHNLLKEEKGSALPLFALFLVIIIGIAGLVIDGGILYKTKSHLKKTVNAAVLSGAQELTNDSDSVNQIVLEILKAHNEENSLKEIIIETNNGYSLEVVLEKVVSLNFLKLFNINSLPVKVSSAVELFPMSRASGAVPLGIDKNIPLEYLKEYTLKVDSGDSEYGNFGILALSGPGGKLYEQDLRYGYDGELKVGDIIETQTGNVEGKTKEAIDFRITSCNHAIDDYSHRECSRIILVLVYEPHLIQLNQLKEVKITGFAYFYLKTPFDKHDSSITGYFIKRVGTGFGDENITDNGAYTIRLTE
ncbi:TadE/TadG family type IV pilus assembly protein [Oceanirhabdus sp. W0125-5]|uniref:TadE/TadG family type IV pilus assembly protein n=1 Tax=Oceanirhabdus sp. W0125-5 TaxID=2999116 RepID=UPI0022F2BEB5|nr:Tad domain-containing protein [Oceanirhabdus sp. W0125-5]WBW95544.1 Tad domain-containing protein [Oceanirhabdus sp. W0125-5]